MKQNIILWVSAAIITFLSGYLESITSPDYPVTGTIGIESKKLSYKLDKVANPIDDLKLLLRTEVDSLLGQVEYRIIQPKGGWKKIPLKSAERILRALVPIPADAERIEYRLRLYKQNREFVIQNKNQPVILSVKGKVPGMVNTLFYLFLFSGLLFSTRTALEFFSPQNKIKKLSILTFFLFCISVIIFLPLKKIYEMQALGNKIIPFGDLLDTALFIIILVWLAAAILVFFVRNYRIIPMVAAIATLILFQLNAI